MHGTLKPSSKKSQTARRCRNCDVAIINKHSGRKRHYCSDRCRKEDNRQLCHETKIKPAGALKKGARYPHSGVSRNAEKNSAVSKTCKADFAGRASANGLWQHIVQTEIIDAHQWHETVST